ncbi:MAG TPA: DUF4328 domain-containing protein [Solirubrobacterales bacterium]|nr:DUF4328 domain-containing protein [Solirubrobacterales bacterium]
MTTGDNGDSDGQPAAGWYPDLSTPGHERLWTGERWIAWIRPARVARSEAIPAGWHEDIGHPGFERLWSGEMWTEEIRRAGETGLPAAGVTEPEGPGKWGTRPGVPATGVPAIPTAVAGAPGAGAFEPAPALRQPPRSVPRRGARYHDDSPPDELGTLGAFVQVALAVVIATEVAQLVANQIYIGVQSDLLAGRLPNIGHLESVIDAVHTTHSLSLIASGLAAILFLVWFYRAYRNLVRAGIEDLRYAPGWALGSWFIPFFNFVRPKQIANDIWKGSASVATVGPERRGELALPASINWWWGLWILGGVCGAIGNGAISSATAQTLYTLSSLRHERTGVWFVQVGLVLLIAAAALAFLLVRKISRMQDAGFTSPVEPATGEDHRFGEPG